jgi:NET1-associated nuclear protein 1 (U3 small nucleolar RNA-associated protein 17)
LHTLAGSGRLAAYAISTTNPNQVYIINGQGIISLWDWTSEKKLGRWDNGSKIRQMVSIARPDVPYDFLYCHELGDTDTISVQTLRVGKDAAESESKQLLKTKSPVISFQVLHHGRFIVVGCHNSILIGKLAKQNWTTFKELAYTWREFQVPKRITAYNAQLRPIVDQPIEQWTTLDIAVGDKDGVIYLFEDVWTAFTRQEKRLKEGEGVHFDSLEPKRLHWHREAVGSVKWSHDGKSP